MPPLRWAHRQQALARATGPGAGRPARGLRASAHGAQSFPAGLRAASQCTEPSGPPGSRGHGNSVWLPYLKDLSHSKNKATACRSAAA